MATLSWKSEVSVLLFLAMNFVYLFHTGEAVHRVVDVDKDRSGRVPEFDDILMMYGKQISQGKEVDELYNVVLNRGVTVGTAYDPQLKGYYYEVIELIKTYGAEALNNERDRLNVIITSVGDRRDPGGENELNYAKHRRNILEAFIDAAADYVMKKFTDANFAGDMDIKKFTEEL